MVQTTLPAVQRYLAQQNSGDGLRLSGDWRIGELQTLDKALGEALAALDSPPVQIDGAGIESLDTAAALLLCHRLGLPSAQPQGLQISGFSDRHLRILQGVMTRLEEHPPSAAAAMPAGQGNHHLLNSLGVKTVAMFRQLNTHLACLGLTAASLAAAARSPGKLRFRELSTQLSQTGLSAVPVVSLVMFLIGAVMAYLLGLQAEQYGANIYVVDGVALGTVREFAPLLVATVVAGRSGASFTAQLGTMKLTEEIDAIRTLGLSAEQVLLLPRVLALMITLPLLVFVGSVLALAGAAVVCDLMLGITPDTFLGRLRTEVALRHYLIGLFKAPVFALVIAVIGCSMGLSVARDTRSIGMNTTATVVQCIVAVVLLNALFAIVFQQLGL